MRTEQSLQEHPEKSFVISERTRVSVEVLIALLALSAWLTSVSMGASANSKAIDDLKVKQAQIQILITDMAVVKSQVESINGKLDREGIGQGKF